MSPRPGWRAAGALALAFGAVLALGRVAILVLLEHVLRTLPLDDALWRVAHDVHVLALHALAAGAGLALIAALRARASGHLAGLVALVLGAALCVSALSGVPLDDAFQTPDPANSRGRMALAVMLALGLALSALALRAARGRPPAWLAPVAAALLLAPLAGLWMLFGRAAPERSVREVVLEAAFEPELWQVARQHPRKEPELGVLTPSLDAQRDGGDRPAILMPPPCELSFLVPQDAAPLSLRIAAGADQIAHRRMLAGDPPVTVGFEVLVDGEPRFERRLSVSRDTPEEERVWSHAGGEAGLAVAPGARVTLRTSVLAPDYANEQQIPVLAVGFGGVVIERTVERRRQRSSEEAPNIVLIVMDTLRQDALSCYGAPAGATPHLDALATRGLAFDNAWSTSSWTWPSTASILTGLWPESHGVEADGSCYLRGTFETLPELLEQRGYATAAFSCNPLIVADHGFAQGFEDFDALGRFRFAPAMIDRPLEWIEMNAGSRFFLYLHLVDPHWPYGLDEEQRAALEPLRPADFPARGVTDWHQRLVEGQGRDENGALLPGAVPEDHLRFMRAEYAAAVRAADAWVGRVLARLAELELDRRTVIAFTSDHGEEFLEHGLATHGNQLYPEVVRVPLILAGPGVPEGERVAARVSNRQVAPTLARFGGARFEGLTDAQDLARVAELDDRPIFFSTHQGWWNGHHRVEIFGLNDGEWSLHWAPRGGRWQQPPAPGGAGEWRLFHVAEDPREERDLAAEEPEKAAELLALLEAHLASASARRPTLTVGIGQRGRDLFTDIGYASSDDDEDEEAEDEAPPGPDGDDPPQVQGDGRSPRR